LKAQVEIDFKNAQEALASGAPLAIIFTHCTPLIETCCDCMLCSDETARWTNENEVLLVMHILHWLAYQTQPVFVTVSRTPCSNLQTSVFTSSSNENGFLGENLQPVMLANAYTLHCSDTHHSIVVADLLREFNKRMSACNCQLKFASQLRAFQHMGCNNSAQYPS
jgi:hypothetical protein